MPTAISTQLMRAVLFYGPQDIRLEQRSIPRAGRGEAVLKIEAALTCAIHAVDKLQLKKSDTVALFGLGNMGRLIILALRKTGARILVLGRNPDRLKLALQAGAHEAIDLTHARDAAAAVKVRTQNR